MTLVDELSEDREKDVEIVKSFYAKDSLSEDIFGDFNGSYKMISSVRERLLEISNNFIEFLGIDFFIHDIVLTGSLANYNWSDYSDVDLHIIIDYEESGHNINLLKEFFDAKKGVWNALHDIKIKKYEVELYVQDINEPHISSGVYSVLNNDWIIQPQKEKKEIDDRKILEKGEEYAKIIDGLLSKKENGENIKDDVDDVKKKIKRFRQSGLEDGGEYSYENLTFKLLRRNGYIKKLIDIKKDVTNKTFSMNESVNFSDRDILKVEKAAINFYGQAYSLKQTGFITPSGYLLDFSEGTGERVQDHRNIGYVVDELGIDIGEYGTDKWKYNTSWGMYAVMDMGFIRYLPESQSIDMNRMPTQEQFQVIRELIRKTNGHINVELNNNSYVEYEIDTPEDYIIEGIKLYFKEGIKPKPYSEVEEYF